MLTNTNWEGVGVAPSIPCEPVLALDVAEADALRKLADVTTATSEEKTEYAWTLVELDARIHPVSPTLAQLAPLAGHFGAPNVGYGEFDVEFRDGALILLRAKRPPARLTPLTEDGVFGIEGSDQLRVRITEDVRNRGAQRLLLAPLLALRDQLLRCVHDVLHLGSRYLEKHSTDLLDINVRRAVLRTYR